MAIHGWPSGVSWKILSTSHTDPGCARLAWHPQLAWLPLSALCSLVRCPQVVGYTAAEGLREGPEASSVGEQQTQPSRGRGSHRGSGGGFSDPSSEPGGQTEGQAEEEGGDAEKPNTKKKKKKKQKNKKRSSSRSKSKPRGGEMALGGEEQGAYPAVAQPVQVTSAPAATLDDAGVPI